MANRGNGEHEPRFADERGIYAHIVADHRRIESLFDEVADARGEPIRLRALHHELKRQILLHTNVEDRVVYTPIEANESFAGAIEHARDEHQQVNALLLELDKLELGGASYMVKSEELKQALKQHVHEEEDAILPAALETLGDETAREMARDYESEKEVELETLAETEPGLSPIDDEELEDLSRDELVELARQRDIEGRSQMSKQQLARALRHQR